MKQGTKNRQMAPPIAFCRCPGGGGHYWPRVNPLWIEGKSRLGRSRAGEVTQWCPEHKQERAEHIGKKISDARRKQITRYDALPLPETRICTNPDPSAHRPGAVLPARKFYKRLGAERSDGTKPIILDSQCKECRKEQTAARRERMLRENPEEFRKRTGERQRAYRKRLSQRRRILARERDKKFDAAPFREWLLDYQHRNGAGAEDICRGSGVDAAAIRRVMSGEQTRVQLSTVDKLGVHLGRISLTVELYPPDRLQEAS